LRTTAHDVEAARLDRHRRGIGLSGEADVDVAVGGDRVAQHHLGLVGMTGDVDRPVGQRAEQRHILRRLVRAAAVGCVVRGANADQDGPDALVREVELDLLERPLDQERCVGMRDGTHAGQCQAGGDADHELLADTDVDDPIRVTALGSDQARSADVGHHHRQPRILVEQLARDVCEAVAHRVGRRRHAPFSTTATTTFG
jgi:hypothetical protein